MKTLIFNGSPRRNGDTVSLINELTEQLNGEYKIVDAYYSDISACVDCRYKNQIILAGVSVLLFLATILVFFAYRFNAQRENKLLLLQQEQDKIKTDIGIISILLFR